jgi:exodeoxyribonuclease V gamma subunit
LELDELLRFWALPVKHIFNQRLQVWFNTEKELIEDEEPFSFNGLERYLLREDMVDALLEGGDSALSKLGHLYRSAGRLPVGSFGGLELAENELAMKKLVKEIEHYASQKRAPIAVDLRFEHQNYTFNLVGWLDEYYGSGLVNYRVGSIRSQDILQAWIKHLCASASGVAVTSHLLGVNNKTGVEYYSLAAVVPSDAIAMLQDLVSLYFEGMEQPIPYFPKSAYEAMLAFVAKAKKDDIESARQMAKLKLNAAYLGDDYHSGEGDNVYIQRVWKEWNNELQDQAMVLAEKILLPAMERLQSKSK